MCGITGIFSYKGNFKIEETSLSSMTDILEHRGPDGNGIYVSPDNMIALGNTRLAIVDPMSTMKQPFETEDKKFVLTFRANQFIFPAVKSFQK